MILQLLIAWLAVRIRRHQDHVIAYLLEENRILKTKLKGKRIQLTDTERRRLAVLAHPMDRKHLQDVSTIATPDTLQRWYRRLVVQAPSGTSRENRLGRPPVAAEIEQLVIRMANENPRWGYRRIQGALSNLGYYIHNTTVRNILRRNHIDPAPIRGKSGISWSQVIRLQWEVLDVSGCFEARLSKMAHLWASLTPLGRELSTWGSQLLDWVFDPTLDVLSHMAQQWHTLWSRYLPTFDVQYPFIFGRRGVPEGSFQSVTWQVKACLVEQDHSPPEPRRALIRPEGKLNCGRSATDSRFIMKPNTEYERGQRFDQRHLTTVEDGVYPVAA
jgi:hypothetical protein